jgi:hypothetical protein
MSENTLSKSKVVVNLEKGDQSTCQKRTTEKRSPNLGTKQKENE